MPYSWLYYDVRYYLEWYRVVWSKQHPVYIVSVHPQCPLLTIPIPAGILDVYREASKASYPPLPIILFIFTHSIASTYSDNVALVRFINKLPIYISYLLITMLLYRRFGKKTCLIWLFNVFSFVTLFSYHMDLIVGLFLLLFYLNHLDGKPFKSGLSLALAFLIKPYCVLSSIPIALSYIKRKAYKDFIKLVVAGTSATLLVIFPFISVDPHSFINKAFLYHTYRYPQEYSLWALPIYLSNFKLTIIPHWLNVAWSPILLFLLIVISILFLREKNVDNDVVLKYTVLISLVSIVVNKVGNLNYIVWILPLFSIYIVKYKLYLDKTFITTYISTSIALGVFAGYTTFYAAFVTGEGIYIIEDQTVYSIYLAEGTFDKNTFQFQLAEFLRVNAYWLYKPLYDSLHISYAIYTVFYNSFLIYSITKVIKVKHAVGT